MNNKDTETLTNETTESAESAEITRVALVTGASQGIGASVVQKLASLGFNVAINHRQSGKGNAAALAKRLNADYGVQCICVQCDVTSFEDVQAMVEEVRAEFGRIDVLVNNAGITRDGLLMRMSEEQFESVIDANLCGTFNCMRHVVPIMVKQRYGRIINISSVVGLYGNAGQANYAASKAGIIGLTKAVAKEVGKRGITVNAIAPGFIETAMTDNLSEKAQSALSERIALGRLGQTEDVAEAVAFFASDSASYITAQVLGVDGGISL